MKQCRLCQETKPLDEFYKNHGRCKQCFLAILRDKRAPGDRREYHLKSMYGISIEEYDRMLAEQNGKCAICLSGTPKAPKRVNHWYIDHCHSTGKVRGLLCNACNRAIGNLGDDISNFERAIAYLKKT